MSLPCRAFGTWLMFPLLIAAGACSDDDTSGDGPVRGLDPDDSPRATIDRFSDEAGTIFVRSADDSLPDDGQAIDFDEGPFVGQGFGPEGQVIRYYHFDAQLGVPSRLFVFIQNDQPVPGQLPIREHLPGDEGYSDFVHIIEVEVEDDDFVPNSITSIEALEDSGLDLSETGRVENRPVVPPGSTAAERVGDTSEELSRAWSDDRVVFNFQFEDEVASAENSLGERRIGMSYIFVSFAINPGEEGGGPASGFKTEEDDPEQTHNVLETKPGDENYSPLWKVMMYDNSAFDDVVDIDSAREAPALGDPDDAPTVNCPVTYVDQD
jgi:hypothetical protein